MKKVLKKIDFKLEGKIIGSCRSTWHLKAFDFLQSFPASKVKKISIHCSNCGQQLKWNVDGWVEFYGPLGIFPCSHCFPGLVVKTSDVCLHCGTRKVFSLENPQPFCPIHN